MTKHKKKGAGGKREGTGAKKKEPTETINFRLPKSRKALLKKLYPKISREFKEWVDVLIKKKENLQ
jgi:hypothetical protein